MAKREVPAIRTPLEHLHDYVSTVIEAYTNPDKKSNEGRLLHDIWLWQEVATYADNALKAAWKIAQAGEDAMIPSDDELRKEPGEAIVADSAHYSAMVRVDAPRRLFNQDAFVAIVARRHGISASKLMGYVEQAKLEGDKAPLTKRIITVDPKTRKGR